MKLSIIIPTLNEEKYLKSTLEHVLDKALHPDNLEIIVVDAGSTDGTLRSIAAIPATSFSDKSFQLQKHLSLNFGLQQAKGEVVLFLDADTLLPRHFDQRIENAIKSPATVGGAFEMRFIDADLKLFLLSKLNSFRYTTWKTFYGDQAIFCTKEIARKVGGFPDSLMEAAYFCRSIKRYGKLALIKEPVKTSPRRFNENGFWNVLWFDIRMWIKFVLGLELKKSKKTYWQTNLQNG